MKKKLTQDHIDKGTRGMMNLCPLALCLKEVYPQCKILVDVETVDKTKYVPNVTVNDEWVEFDDPDKVADFIIRYDASKAVKPFFLSWKDM